MRRLWIRFLCFWGHKEQQSYYELLEDNIKRRFRGLPPIDYIFECPRCGERYTAHIGGDGLGSVIATPYAPEVEEPFL